MERPGEVAARKLFLHDAHTHAGARFNEVDGWLVPVDYGNSTSENLAVRESVGVADLFNKGYLKVSGPDRASFLQGITTNDTSNLHPGDGLHSALLNVKGRVIADFILLSFEDHFLLEVEVGIREKLQTELSKYRIREKVMIERIEDIGPIGVQGPNSPDLLRKLTNTSLPPLTTYHHFTSQTEQAQFTIRNQTLTGETGYIITAQKSQLASLWSKLLETNSEPKAKLIGFQAMESLRIEAGIPRYGFDITEENFPLEIDGEDMISYTKGCYVGQEVIARLKFQGQANKHLKGLLITSSISPKRNSMIMKDEQEIGRVTSSAYSPSLSSSIAMAYLRREYATPGNEISVQTETERLHGAVTNLPFIKR